MPRKRVEYIGIPAAARKWGVTAQSVHRWVEQDRIPGLRREPDPLGREVVMIPADAERPAPRKRGPKPREK